MKRFVRRLSFTAGFIFSVALAHSQIANYTFTAENGHVFENAWIEFPVAVVLGERAAVVVLVRIEHTVHVFILAVQNLARRAGDERQFLDRLERPAFHRGR